VSLIGKSAAPPDIPFLKNSKPNGDGKIAGSFILGSKNVEFGNCDIVTVFRNYNSQSFQKLNQIKANLESAQNQMTANVTLTLTRGEQLFK
jgi:hypothetical protein